MHNKTILSVFSSRLFHSAAFLLMVSVSGTSLCLAAAPSASKPLYPWKTESAKDEKSGAMQHCLVKNAYDNGTLLLLAENHDGMQRLAIHFPEDVLQQGMLVDLTLQVDKQDVFPVEGMTSSPRVLAMNIPEAFPEQLRKGNILHVRGPEDAIAYQLQGTDQAVQALRDCVTSHKNPSLTRTRLAAISDADADMIARKPVGKTIPKEMMEPLRAPVSAAEMQKNLGLDPADMLVTTQEKADAQKMETAKTDMPVIPVPAVKADTLAQPSSQKTIHAESQSNTLPAQWQFIFNDLAAAPNGKTLTATKAGMTEPLQYAWIVKNLKIGLHTGKPLDKEGFAQAAKHYMFNIRRNCQGEFIAEAGEQKTSSRGIEWQIAETVCADKSGETLAALLFTSSDKESATVVIQGDMKDAAHLIRFRNHVLEMMNNQ